MRFIGAPRQPEIDQYTIKFLIGAIALALPIVERLLTAADSTGQRNGLAEHLSRRAVAKGLSWPLVQLSCYGVELGL
jgi:hypothetical protein